MPSFDPGPPPTQSDRGGPVGGSVTRVGGRLQRGLLEPAQRHGRVVRLEGRAAQVERVLHAQLGRRLEAEDLKRRKREGKDIKCLCLRCCKWDSIERDFLHVFLSNYHEEHLLGCAFCETKMNSKH